MAPLLMGHSCGATVVLLAAFVVFLVTIPSISAYTIILRNTFEKCTEWPPNEHAVTTGSTAAGQPRGQFGHHSEALHADARCRFASSSASQDSCIFPCRCTKGCNTTTGDCLDDGRCMDGHPSDHRWSGPACQIGNVAYRKSASQVSYTWGDQFPADRAVDGNVDQWRSHEHCALPDRGQGTNAWWQVDLGGIFDILRVEIYTGNSTRLSMTSQDIVLLAVQMTDGALVVYSGATEDCQKKNGECQTECAPHFKGDTCQECKDGYFGNLFDRTCHCRSGSCDKTTGHCPSGCATGWTGDNCQTDSRGLSTFTLSVGNSSDRTDHMPCASHSGVVVSGAVVKESCTATGRYVSYQRTKDGEPRLTALCEVVVIGHPHISCEKCPKSSACNNVVGCDECEPGKQQPDCETECEKGYYGVNCKETCGNCTDISQCAATTGVCGSGCVTWYAPGLCKTYIEKPNFLSSDKPDVEDITSSSVTVNWPKATQMTFGLEDKYYHYILWLKAGGDNETNIKSVSQDGAKPRMDSDLTGLRFNTYYTVRVQPYREHNGERDLGTATGVVRFKTNCTVPVIENVITSTPDWPTNTSIVVRWKAINESGCDALIDVRVSYKRRANSQTWTDVKIELADQTQVTITGLSYDVYAVKLTATNNEHVSASSEILTINLATTTTTTTTTTTVAPDKEKLVDDGGSSVGMITGVTFAVIFVLVGVFVVVVIILRRRHAGDGSTSGIAMGLFGRSKKGTGNDNVELDVENEEEGDEINDERPKAANSQAIYANMLDLSHSVPVTGLAAYVEEKRRHNGFKKEFEVSYSSYKYFDSHAPRVEI
ncbi:hypothetical protein NP493_2014g00018 [Ridgeia piscesae]|uniref:Fibronectin type-III domain-containing protein n=1 Tax=Ridgeia piscesae TaxID=27915 RepID=A0AAD9N5A6_RIDPI|nr:hypothetical protein NP493_2014g00018 [Ridgeia piscesae]